MNRKLHTFLRPEIYLIASTLYYWFLTSNLINPIAIVLLLIFTYQFIYKKLTLGLVIATIFILLNLFLVLALISELSEFPEPNENYNMLLIFGSLYLGFNLIVGGFMFKNYLKRKIT